MKFWITDGIIHHELTKDKDWHAQEYQVYPDEGVSLEISENSECITIPDGVIAIGKKAFKTSLAKKEKKWKSLKRVILPKTLQIIDDSAFEGCSALEDIVLPEKLEKLGAFALYATGIRVVRLPEGLKEIDNFCFTASQLETITFPTSPTKIEDQAFNGCPNIKLFTIPNYIDHSMGFSGCTSLEKVENLKWDTATSFCGCHSLKEMVIPDGAKTITMKAFMDCNSLQELTIPSSVKQVYGLAFTGCTGLKKLTLKSAFKGFETAFPDSKEVSEVYITESAAGKAHLVFPEATIFSLRGKELFSPDKTSSKTNGTQTPDIEEQSTSPAVNGELVPNSGVKKFTNYTVDIDGLHQSFHVEFRGSQIANRICKTCYTNAAKAESSEKLYDAIELIRANGDLYTIESHTGVRIPTLSEDYEMMGEKRSYSTPLEPNEITEYVKRFSIELACCLTKTNIAKITEYVPHKKNGTLAKNRTTLILKAGWADSEGNTIILLAKNVADNDLDLEVKKIYIGEEKYDESEAARLIGIVGSVPTRKDKAKEKALSDPYGFEEKGYTARCSKDNVSVYPEAKAFYQKYEKYLSTNPIITFPGKTFVFSQMFQKENALEQPIVKEVLARGGIYRDKVSGLTDYLVAESLQSVGEYKMRMAAEQIDKGKPLQFITAAALIDALKTEPTTSKADENSKQKTIEKAVESKPQKATTVPKQKEVKPKEETKPQKKTEKVVSAVKTPTSSPTPKASEESTQKKVAVKESASSKTKTQNIKDTGKGVHESTATDTKAKEEPKKKTLIEMSLEEKQAIYTKHIVSNPNIQFRSKLFAFAGVFKRSDILDAQPIVKAIREKGGDIRTTVSQVTDYLVVSSVDNSEDSKMRKAVEWYEIVKKPQMILLKDLEKALGYPTQATQHANSSTTKYKLTDDMLPDGIEDREAIEQELSKMEPEQAQTVLEAMAGLKKLQGELKDIGNIIAEEQRKEEEEQARKAAEIQRQRNEEIEARRRTAEREKQIAQTKRTTREREIKETIQALQIEMNSLKGLFASFKRKKIQKQIDDLNDELRRL